MATTARPPSAGQASGWLVPTLTLTTFVTMTSAFGLGPFLPVIAQELDTPVSLVGQIPAGMLLLSALLGLGIGPLADYLGYRRVLVIGVLTVVASALATGFAGSYPVAPRDHRLGPAYGASCPCMSRFATTRRCSACSVGRCSAAPASSPSWPTSPSSSTSVTP